MGTCKFNAGVCVGGEGGGVVFPCNGLVPYPGRSTVDILLVPSCYRNQITLSLMGHLARVVLCRLNLTLPFAFLFLIRFLRTTKILLPLASW